MAASCIKILPSGLRQFLATKSPLKMKKNAFYLTSKTFFVLKLFKFLSKVLVMQQNGLSKGEFQNL